MDRTTQAAFEAISRGFQAIPLRPHDKVPVGAGWQHRVWPEETTQADVDAVWASAQEGLDGQLNLGVLLGAPSRNLLDVDLDHYRTARLKDYFLPPTPARGGRAGKPNSHYWYIAEEGTLPGTRQHLMPKTDQNQRGAVIVELRSTGAQTVLPPSIHPSGEAYAWSNERWGGEKGPALVNGRRLAVQVALLAVSVVLLEHWPTAGSRHEAYLALAGGLLRDGDQVHPYWEQNAAVLIRALAEATLDDDGPDAREAESIHTTINSLKSGKPTTGFGRLAEIIGDRTVEQVRVLIGEVESAAGVQSRQSAGLLPVTLTGSTQAVDAGRHRLEEERRARDEAIQVLDDAVRDPLEERIGTWEPLDIDPYLSGRVQPVMPSVLQRSDGQYLMYPGRVNMLYGSSESAKSWIALYTCIQEMAKGQRTLYLDFEDEPVNTLNRLMRMGAKPDDLRFLFTYVRPEEGISPMQINRWGSAAVTSEGQRNWEIFQAALDQADPSLIVADGMTVLYGLHGLDTNDASSTDIITGWLKRLTRNGRSTVIIIDHTTKGAERGTTPIGSQHKQAMVQGTMLQVWARKQPMPGEIGEVELLVLKDRPGQVRAASQKSGEKMQSAAWVTLDSTVPDVTTMTINPPPSGLTQAASGAIDLQRQQAADRAEKLQRLEEAVKWAFGGEKDRWLPTGELEQALGITPRSFTGLMNRMIEQGYLEQAEEVKGPGSGKGRPRKGYKLVIGLDGYNASLDIDLSTVSTFVDD